MLKAFCDGCRSELGVVQAGRQDARERGHNRRANVPVGGGLVLDVQLHVVPPTDQHVCASCAKRALDRAWSVAPNDTEDGQPPAGETDQETA